MKLNYVPRFKPKPKPTKVKMKPANIFPFGDCLVPDWKAPTQEKSSYFNVGLTKAQKQSLKDYNNGIAEGRKQAISEVKDKFILDCWNLDCWNIILCDKIKVKEGCTIIAKALIKDRWNVKQKEFKLKKLEGKTK